MRPYVEELAQRRRHATSAATRTPACRTRFGGYDETPEHDGAACSSEFARAGLAEHRRRLLRHDAAHIARDRRGGARRRAARACRRSSRAAAPLRPRAARHRRRTRNFVNVGERTNVTGSPRVREADPGRRLRRGARRSRASRSRTARRSSTSTWTRACSTREAAMTTFLQPRRRRARHRARADDGRLLEVEVIEAGLKCVQGKGDRQLDLAQGRRGRVPASRRSSCAATARRSW